MHYDKNITPSCAYCRIGANLGNDEIACVKHGIVTAEQSCSAFKYEPTKRVPPTPPVLKTSGLSEEDFSL